MYRRNAGVGGFKTRIMNSTTNMVANNAVLLRDRMRQVAETPIPATARKTPDCLDSKACSQKIVPVAAIAPKVFF